MKTFTLTDKLTIRGKIWRATGKDPGSVHPDYFLSATRGGIHAGHIGNPPRKPSSLSVHFLPVHPGPSTRWMSFNLN